MNHVERLGYRYWSKRRIHTVCWLMWGLGSEQALSDGGYCLDRPDGLGK